MSLWAWAVLPIMLDIIYTGVSVEMFGKGFECVGEFPFPEGGIVAPAALVYSLVAALVASLLFVESFVMLLLPLMLWIIFSAVALFT